MELCNDHLYFLLVDEPVWTGRLTAVCQGIQDKWDFTSFAVELEKLHGVSSLTSKVAEHIESGYVDCLGIIVAYCPFRETVACSALAGCLFFFL